MFYFVTLVEVRTLNEKLDSFWGKAKFLIFAYPIGAILWIIFWLLRLLKIIRIQNQERFPVNFDKLVIVANHPSVIDPFLVAMLCLNSCMRHPFKKAMLIFADKASFYDRKWLFWARPIIVPVMRVKGEPPDVVRTARNHNKEQIARATTGIGNGRPAIIFPEGGRTFKGEEGDYHFSANGKRMRILEPGVGIILRKTEAVAVMVWVEGPDHVVPNSRNTLFTRFHLDRLFRRGITIKIGKPINVALLAQDEQKNVTEIISARMMVLADE